MVVAEDDDGWMECQCERCGNNWVTNDVDSGLIYCDGCWWYLTSYSLSRYDDSDTVPWLQEGF